MPLINDLLPIAQAEPGGFRDVIDNLARTPLSQVVAFVAVLTVVRLAIYPVLLKTPPHKRTGIFPVFRFLNEMLDAFVYAGVFVFMLIRPFLVQAFLIPSGSMFPTLYVNDFIVANKAIYRYSTPKLGDIVVFRPPVYAASKDQIGPDGQVKVDFIKRCRGLPNDVVQIKNGILYRNGVPDAADASYKHFSHTPDNGQTFEEIPPSDVQGGMPDFKIVHYMGPYAPWHDKYVPVITVQGQPNYDGSGIAREYAIGVSPTDDPSSPFVGAFKRRDELTSEENERMSYLLNAPPAAIPPHHYLMMGDNRNNSFDGRCWGLIDQDDVIGRSEFIWLPLNRIGRTR